MKFISIFCIWITNPIIINQPFNVKDSFSFWVYYEKILHLLWFYLNDLSDLSFLKRQHMTSKTNFGSHVTKMGPWRRCATGGRGSSSEVQPEKAWLSAGTTTRLHVLLPQIPSSLWPHYTITPPPQNVCPNIMQYSLVRSQCCPVSSRL